MPNVDLGFQAGQAFTNLKQMKTLLDAAGISMEGFAVNTVKVNSSGDKLRTTMSAMVSPTQKMTATFKEAAGVVELLGYKIDNLTAAGKKTASTTATLVAARAGYAKIARDQLEKSFSTAGFTADQANSQQSRINQITSAIARGRAELSQLQNAIAAQAGTFTGTLDETSQKILTILNRIKAAGDKVGEKAATALSTQKAKTLGELHGQQTAGSLYKKYGSQIDALDPAAAERVRNQIDKINNLFSHGLDSKGYAKAFNAFRTGAVTNLTAVEREARHRLERIQIEIDRVGHVSFLDKLFGGKQGGGVFADPKALAASLLMADAITQVTNNMRAQLDVAADYSVQIGLIRTITQDTALSYNQWSEGITQVSNLLGRSRQEIANSGYELLSNQITNAADTFRVLATAGNLALTTNTKLVDSQNLISSALQSFGLDQSQTEKVAAQFFTTIDLGRIKIEDLANAYGRSAVPAKALGISMEELNAALITVSQTGIGVQQTQTLVTNVIHKLLNPTKELQELYNRLGVGTGEMFIKTYRLSGVLKILKEETRGSSAELAKYFNEIRGEQGIQALTDRLGIFEDALDKVTNSTDGFKKAVDKINETPGQKLKVELNKLENSFNNFKDIALEALISINDSFVSVSKAAIILSGALITVGGAFGLAFSAKVIIDGVQAIQLATKALLGYQLTLAATAPLVAAVFAPAAIGAFIAILAHTDKTLANLHERYREEIDKTTAKENEAAKKSVDDETNTFIDRMKTRRGAVLQFYAEWITNIDRMKVKQDEVVKDAGKALENVGQVFGTGLRKQIEDLESKIKKLEDVEKKIRERPQEIRARTKDFNYDYAMKRNEIEMSKGNPDRSGTIIGTRVFQLRKAAIEFTKAQASGADPEGLEKAAKQYEKAISILQQAATETVQTPYGEALKYTGVIQLINKLNREQLANETRLLGVIEQQRKAKEKQADALRTQLKDLEDAGKKVFGFSLDSDELKGKKKEDILSIFDERARAYEDQIRETADGQRNPALLHQVVQSIGTLRREIEKDLNIVGEKDFAQRNREKANKSTDPARLQEIAARQKTARDEAQRAFNTGHTQIRQLIGKSSLQPDNLLDAFNPFSPTLNPFEERPRFSQDITTHLQKAQKLFEGKDFDAAISTLEKALQRATKTGQGNIVIPGKTLKTYDKEGKVQEREYTLTDELKEGINQARVAKEAAANEAEIARQRESVMSETEKAIITNEEFAKSFQHMTTPIQDFTDKGVSKFISGASSLNDALGGLNENLETFVNDAVQAAAKLSGISNPNQGLTEEQKAAGATPSLLPQPTSGNYHGGLIRHMASGGLVTDFLHGDFAQGSDRIPVMASDHEFMMNQQATGRFLPQLIAMNAGFGRNVGNDQSNNYNFGDMHISVKGGDGAHQTAKEIVSGIKRGISRGKFSL